MDRTKFFDSLRGTVLFPHGFTDQQVKGLDRLLDVWYGLPISGGIETVVAKTLRPYSTIDGNTKEKLAYNLATSFHETGARLWPITEHGSIAYFEKYNVGTKLGTRLGNTKIGDGFKFRGMGDVQNTGRRNAAFSSKKLTEFLGIPVDFEANPLDRLDPVLSAHSLFLGNQEGWWTGKNLGQFISSSSSRPLSRQFVAARAVVNGSDKANQIANYAMVFQKALASAGA